MHHRTDNKERREIKQVQRNYQKTLFRYAPKPYPGQITLLAADEEQHTNPFLDWGDLAMGGIEVHKIPGDHKSHLEVHYQTTAVQLKHV